MNNPFVNYHTFIIDIYDTSSVRNFVNVFGNLRQRRLSGPRPVLSPLVTKK